MNNDTQMKLIQIPVENLRRGRYQPRKLFKKEELQELANSIKEKGIIQPLAVRPLSNNQYEIIAGERRWRAAQIAKLEKVPCTVKLYSDEQAATISLIENIQRQALNPIEEAKAYQVLADEFGYTHEQIAEATGQCRSKISNSFRLLQIDENVQQLLIDGKLSEGHGKVLAGLPRTQQYRLAKGCITHHWSVRQLERAVRQKDAHSSVVPKVDADTGHFIQWLGDKLGTEVMLEKQGASKAGWLKLKYYDVETLEGLIQKMGLDYNPN